MANPQRTFTLADFQMSMGYEHLNIITPSLQGTPEADWADAFFLNNVKMWHQVQLNDDEILTTGALWLTEIGAEQAISLRTAIMGLRLSLSLKSMDVSRVGALLTLPVRGPDAIDGVAAAVYLPALDTFSDTPFALRAPQIFRAGNQPLGQVVPAQNQAQNNAANAPAGDDTDRIKRYAYTYIAAYLMRVMVKSPENIVHGLPRMKERFESFYGASRIITAFTMPMQKIGAYKEALLCHPNTLSTFTAALAYTQSTVGNEQSIKESGLLSYLGYLPFSYTGLHAYTLMMDLKNASKIPLGRLLSMFIADINLPALDKIAYVVNTFERTVTHPTRPTYFRYCATWGPQYFMSLRSSKCPHLVYTAACALKILASGDDVSDPENIAASARLSLVMRRTLKTAGDIIGNTLKNNMLGGVGVSVAYAEAIGRPAEAPADDIGDDWEI